MIDLCRCIHDMTDLCRANKGYIGNLLSANDALFSHNETAQEFIVNLIRDLRGSTTRLELTQEIHEKFWGMAKDKHQTYADLMANRPMVEMMLGLYDLRDYFVTTKLFQPYFLHKQLGITAGVSGIIFCV